MKSFVIWITSIICLLAGFIFWCFGYREFMAVSMICAILCSCTLLLVGWKGGTKK